MFALQPQSYRDRSEFLGLAGMVTLNNSETDGLNRIPVLDVCQVAQDINDGGKRFLPLSKLTWLHVVLPSRHIFRSDHSFLEHRE